MEHFPKNIKMSKFVHRPRPLSRHHQNHVFLAIFILSNFSDLVERTTKRILEVTESEFVLKIEGTIITTIEFLVEYY